MRAFIFEWLRIPIDGFYYGFPHLQLKIEFSMSKKKKPQEFSRTWVFAHAAWLSCWTSCRCATHVAWSPPFRPVHLSTPLWRSYYEFQARLLWHLKWRSYIEYSFLTFVLYFAAFLLFYTYIIHFHSLI